VFAPDRAVLANGERSRLRRFFGADFAVLHTALTVAAIEEVTATVTSGIGRPAGVSPISVPGNHLVLCPPPVAAVAHGGAAVHRGGAGVTVLADVGPGVAPYRPGYWYLIRPDGHVAAAGPAARLNELSAVLAGCSGAATLPAVRATTA
jgi:hypothetical protein